MSENQDKPDHQRPELPEFWDKRFSAESTPWNAGGVPAALAAYAAGRDDRPRTLVPGCGHAWEAGWLAARGWEVTALDFSPTAIDTARAILGDWPGQLLLADFFRFAPAQAFDLIYERAFLCAMPRRLWPDYGPRIHRLLAPGGCLAGFFFFGDDPKGPPFGIRPAALDALLEPWLECVDDRAVADSIPVFAGRERWQVWRRRDRPAPPAAHHS